MIPGTNYDQYQNETMNGKLFRIGSIFFRSYHFNVIHINKYETYMYKVIFAELNMDWNKKMVCTVYKHTLYSVWLLKCTFDCVLKKKNVV